MDGIDLIYSPFSDSIRSKISVNCLEALDSFLDYGILWPVNENHWNLKIVRLKQNSTILTFIYKTKKLQSKFIEIIN